MSLKLLASLLSDDVRLGEHLTPQDYQRIVLGNPEKQVRLFLESFWIDKVRAGDRFLVRDAEILRKIGTGKVVWVSDYVGAREFLREGCLAEMPLRMATATAVTDYTDFISSVNL